MTKVTICSRGHKFYKDKDHPVCPQCWPGRYQSKRPKINAIDAYIAGFPDDIQKILQRVRRTIRDTAPQATETISYAIPTFDLHGKHLVHFAGYKHHIGFYPTSSGIAAFQKDIAQYKNSKGAVQFPIDKPIPWALIKKIVAFRVQEVEKL